ncbi:hypothetical protein DFH09DRAFT_920643 [Mycena vulgaris]|nr:hypothetical protein DFH09DRAFT_920643 [Mycena vulgaris]
MSRDPRLPQYLPQCSFGPETRFENLVEQNVFFFRVHTPKLPTLSGASFTALKFDGKYTVDPGSPSPHPSPPKYSDAARYMNWTTQHSSPSL